MNARVAFDTHAFVKRLEAAGMTETQAEALAGAMGDIVLPAIATESHVKELGRDLRAETKELGRSLRAETKELEHNLRAETKELGHNLRAEIRDLELRLTTTLTNRMGAMIAGSAALTVAILGALATFS
jgi:alkanesulfonate monooxygenase SsuD/methylene tetrahydromethanopterin reductase-like flavin-dependent oxidoreductase (luciferase family)